MKSGLAAANLLWPEFKVVDDLVFFTWSAPKLVNLNHWHDRTEAESTLNHTHVLDCFAHGASLSDEPWWNQEHPDFKSACVFGRVWAEAVAAKLAKDFPERRFFVYFTERDNPIVRFHQEHPGDAPWLDIANLQEDIQEGSVVVHHVCGLSQLGNR